MWLSLLAAGLLFAVMGEPSSAQPSGRAPAAPPPQAGRAAAPCLVRATLEGIINAGTADYLIGALATAEEQGCGGFLLVLDTPGGELEATRAIVRAMLDAPLPVVVHVAPAGAHAGSAGMFVTIAAHVAAMAPATSIGAAHPVLGMGGGEISDVMEAKVVNDVAALARGIAVLRRRNAEWAELAVRESASATAEEARALGVIDLVATSQTELIEALDGREVEVRGRPVRLETAGARLVEVEMTTRQKLLAFLGNPNVAYLLLMVGMLGLLIELSSPGLVVPGLAGAIALLLAVIGMDLLPVNLGAVALLLLGAGLLVAEIYVTSYGLLLLAGLGLMLAGSALLIDPAQADFFGDPNIGVSWGAVVPIALLLVLVAGLLAWQAGRTGRRPATTGAEALLGQTGTTTTDVEDDAGGWVSVAGESWRARAPGPIPAGRPVEIRAVRGLSLEVEEIHQRGPEP